MKRFRLNALDIVIIVILVLAIAAAAFFLLKGRLASKETVVEEKVNISFDIEMTNLTKDMAEGIHEGTVTLGNKNIDKGEITAVKVEPYKKLNEDKENGEFVWVEVPDKYMATITVEKEVTDTETAYKGESEEYRIGEMMSFRGKGFAGWGGYIVRLDVIK